MSGNLSQKANQEQALVTAQHTTQNNHIHNITTNDDMQESTLLEEHGDLTNNTTIVANIHHMPQLTHPQPLRNNEHFGDTLDEKSPMDTRLYFINLNGFSTDAHGGSWNHVCEAIPKLTSPVSPS